MLTYYSEAKGVYKSTDNGLNWQRSFPNPTQPWIDYLAMGVNHNDIIFAGTGGGGLYRSTDKGETWVGLTEYLASECWAIAFNDSDYVFAGDGDQGVFLNQRMMEILGLRFYQIRLHLLR